ncbi:MAG TPA: VanW family protein [Candidatus Levybacteria bacterium]|nr:VanW family protein [Candidatus Levybacteria bacterium]
MKIPFSQKYKKPLTILIPSFWFLTGFTIAAITLTSIIIIYFQKTYADKVIPGVFVENTYIGELPRQEVESIFNTKNERIHQVSFTLSHEEDVATVSAKDLNIGYDTQLIVDQAMSLGKNSNILSDMAIIIDAYLNGLVLKASYTSDAEKVQQQLIEIDKKITVEPVNALFTVNNNRVTAFQQSSDGQAIDYEKLTTVFESYVQKIVREQTPKTISLQIPVTVIKPEVPTEKANNLGIVEVISQGVSHFAGSIPNRIHNVSLAASKINGVLIAPDEVFSFNKAIGDISRYTGYKEAYVISGGKTILGDGGGVCQVSTTLFRAALNAGIPIEERYGHAYRVGYYEQQSPPGLDATIYVPTVDFKFKNDTKHHILIQSYVDPSTLTLTFTMYGTKDGREVSITTPVISSQSPPPAPVYQDDPTLPKDTIKQVEYAAPGAVVTFSRTVMKDGQVHISDNYTTRYRPWGAVYLKGTKEG